MSSSTNYGLFLQQMFIVNPCTGTDNQIQNDRGSKSRKTQINISHTVQRKGYRHRRADERHGNSPQRLPGAIQRQSWKTPGELGVSKFMECDIFPSVLWHCWLGNRKGTRPVKNPMLVCWWWWSDWSFAQLIAPLVQLSPPPPSSLASINTG